MQKTFDFSEADRFEKRWKQKYVLRELNGAEFLQCDEEAFEVMGDQLRFNYEKWRMALLSKSLVKPKSGVKQFKTMPASLLSFLLEQATKLNTITPEERLFLLKEQHLASEHLTQQDSSSTEHSEKAGKE